MSTVKSVTGILPIVISCERLQAVIGKLMLPPKGTKLNELLNIMLPSGVCLFACLHCSCL